MTKNAQKVKVKDLNNGRKKKENKTGSEVQRWILFMEIWSLENQHFISVPPLTLHEHTSTGTPEAVEVSYSYTKNA